MGVQPEVERCEIYLQGFAFWSKPSGGNELCMVIGSRLSPDSLGKIDQLTPGQCGLLAEEGTVVIDESDVDRLGVKGVGSVAEISGHPVRVVGLTHGLKSLAGPYVFCSVPTARQRLPVQPGRRRPTCWAAAAIRRTPRRWSIVCGNTRTCRRSRPASSHGGRNCTG